jgi:hypothetical protein
MKDIFGCIMATVKMASVLPRATSNPHGLAKILYPGLWCILFIITGLLIRIIKLMTGSEDQEMTIVIYACFVASAIALCFMTCRMRRAAFFFNNA